MSAEAAAPVTGDRIGELVSDRYRIVEKIGEGGMGAVYVAEHTHMRKRVALKLLHAEMAQNEEVVARFRREAEAVAALDHPHVAAATDFGQLADGSFFLVLEYVDGISLRKALREAPFSPARALWVARQIALALDRAHAAGIVHRDLKPENVMLVRKEDDPDFVKVLDFGVARFEPSQERGEGKPLTRVGTVMGTPEYMAPEQALGQRVSSRADLYALGVVLYEMLTAVLPFEGDTMALLSLQIVAPVPPMADRAPSVTVPRDVEALVFRLLEKDENVRLGTATELIAAIDAVAAANGIELRVGASPSGRFSVPDVPPSERSHVVARQSASTVAPGKSTPQAQALAVTIAAVPTPVAPPAPSPKASPIARLAAFADGPQARAFLSTLRRQSDEVLAKLEAATKLPRPTVIAILAGVVALFVGIGLTTFGVLVFRTKTVPARATVVSLPSTTATPEKIRAAAAKGSAALEALAEQYPQDAAVLRELAFSYDARERTSEALATIERITKLDSGPVPPELVRLVIRATTKNESIDPAFTLLEGGLGAAGVDALVEISQRKDITERARTRAASSLKKEAVLALATPATSFLIDLDGATTCEARLAVLERSGKDADGRALGRLNTLKSTRGCGRGGRYDCHACLRNDDTLERTIRAASKRDGL